MMKSENFVSKPFRSFGLLLLAFSLFFVSCNDEEGTEVVPDPTGTLNVADQNMNSGVITVSQVVLDQNGWVVIHRATEGGGPMVPDIISEPEFVEAGAKTNVMVSLKEGEKVAVNETVHVMLHTDTGQEMVYEFDGGDTPDQPIMSSSGNIVMSSVTNVGPSGAVSVSNQFIAETDNRFVVDEVMLEEGGWVVVHRATAEGGPVVPAIVSEPKYLEAGTYTDVMVALKEGEEVAVDETFFVMLHDDTDDDEVYSFTGAADSEDIPLFNAGNIVMVSAMNSYTFNDDTENTMYPLTEVNGSGMYGTATLYRAARGTGTYVVLDLEGTAEGEAFPAHIHQGVAGSNGPVVASLNDVTGAEGESVTFVNVMDDGTPVTYDNLLAYNGYVNVHGAEVLATGNIGANGSALTGETKAYNLSEMAMPGVMGTATFWELANGSTLVQLMLEGTSEGDMHPAHIHRNTAAEGGSIAVSLESVNGKSGQSFTFVEAEDDGTALTYSQLLDYNGYINVHRSMADLGTLAAQGDIGQNELSGEETAYALESADANTDVNGTVTFKERKNGKALVVIALENTVPGVMHPAHIHEGMVGDNGAIAFPLSAVNGTTGMSMTSINVNEAGAEVSYDDLLNYDGYVNVHMSAADLATVVATGNIGASAE